MVDGLETLRTGIEDTEAEIDRIDGMMHELAATRLVMQNLADGLRDALSLAELGAETVATHTVASINDILGNHPFDQEA